MRYLLNEFASVEAFDETLMGMEETAANIDGEFKQLVRLETANNDAELALQAVNVLSPKNDNDTYTSDLARFCIERVFRHDNLVQVSVESFQEASIASLEASLKETLGTIWESIVKTLMRLYKYGQSLWERYRRATEGMMARARSLRIGIKNIRGELPETNRNNGKIKLIEGSVRPWLHRMGYDKNGQLQFDDKSITVLNNTIALFKEYARNDLEIARKFKTVLASSNVDDVTQFEKKELKKLGALNTEQRELIKGSEMIGGLGLYAERGIIASSPTVEALKFTNLATLNLSVQRFGRIRHLQQLVDIVLDGCSEVRSYNQTSSERFRLSQDTEREIEKLKRVEQTTLSDRRRIAVAWSKIAFRRSDLTSLTLVRAMDTALRIVRAFVP